MQDIIQSPEGALHFAFTVIAMLTGTAVLFLKKATKLHIRIGYVYVFSMLGVNLTAFLMYRLFGGFGIFHAAAVLSLFSIPGGMLPLLIKTKNKKRFYFHFMFMYWSVMGLYAAFVAEALTRIPETPFFHMVGFATGGVMLVGGVAFGIKKKKWLGQFVR